MNGIVQQIREKVESTDQAKYSEWDAELFSVICTETGEFLEKKLEGDNASLKAYLQLISEGIGRGLIVNSLNPEYAEYYLSYKDWNCFLEYLLIGIVPCELSSYNLTSRLGILVEVWNIGEGILNDETWMDPYILSCAKGTKPSLNRLIEYLASIIDPIYETRNEINWLKKKTIIVDCREIAKDFLPGEMFLSAENVVCIKDRRNTSLVGGVILKGEEAILISHNKLFSHFEIDPNTELKKGHNQIFVNDIPITLPYIGEVAHAIVSNSGYVLASADDSQQLWIVKAE